MLKNILLLLLIIVFSYIELWNQNLSVEGLFDFNSTFQQKNISVSEKIKEEWNLQNSSIQLTYYNAYLDSEIESVEKIKQVLSIHNLLNGNQQILELKDDGNHFDNNVKDGIFGNCLVDDFGIFRTDESIIDIELDTIGLNYLIQYVGINYLPEVPLIIKPQHESTISTEITEISWKIDINADGCGVLLLDNTPFFGAKLENIVWQEKFGKREDGIYNERIPVQITDNEEYILLVWAFTNTKKINNIWNRGAYSMEWSKFYTSTLDRNKNLMLFHNYPNPFSSNTIIFYNLPEDGNVSIKIFDILGREITTLINCKQTHGEHHILWNGKNNSGNIAVSGIYFYNMIFEGYSITKKISLVR